MIIEGKVDSIYQKWICKSFEIGIVLNFNNDNNNNIYLYRANSTLQFSNVPYNKRTVYYKYIKYNKIWSKIAKKIILQVFKILQYTCMVKVTGKKKCQVCKLQSHIRKSFFKKMDLQITFKNVKSASKI